MTGPGEARPGEARPGVTGPREAGPGETVPGATEPGARPGGAARPFRLRSVAVTAFGPTVLEAIGYGATVPVLPLLARQLGAGVGKAALVAAVLGLGQLLASLPAGSLIARIGERRALILAAVLGVACAAVAGSARSVEVLMVASLVTGMTWSVFLLARQGFMIDAVPADMRARALSSLGGSHRIGMVIGPLIAAPVIAQFGVRAAYAVAAAAGLSALLLVLRVPDLGAGARAESRAEPTSTWRVLRDHRHTFATLGVGVLAITGLRAVRIAVVPLWGDHIGLSAASVSLLFAIAAAIEVVIFYPAGWVMDRLGRAYVAIPTAASLSLGLLLLPLARNWTALLLLSIAMAIGNGLGSGIVMTLGADTAPIRHRARYLGGWRLCGDLGASGAPLVISGVAALGGLAAACVTLGGLGCLATGWIAHWVRVLDRDRAAELAGNLRDRPDHDSSPADSGPARRTSTQPRGRGGSEGVAPGEDGVSQ